MNYTFTTILSTDSIGDSLSSINNNYSQLDTWLNSIQLSAQNYWIPMMNLYNSIKSELYYNVDLANTNKPNWDSMTSLVNINSARWINPLVIIYPELIEQIDMVNNTITNDKFNKITDWLNNTYSPITDKVQYVEKQKAYIYLIKKDNQQPVQIVKQLKDTANCYTVNQTQCVQCKTDLVGTVICSNGIVSCDGVSFTCQHCQSVPCYYEQTGTTTYNPSIEVWLNLKFQDLRESTNISCLIYQIKDCVWSFVNQI